MGNSESTHIHTRLKPVPMLVGMGTTRKYPWVPRESTHGYHEKVPMGTCDMMTSSLSSPLLPSLPITMLATSVAALAVAAANANEDNTDDNSHSHKCE